MLRFWHFVLMVIIFFVLTLSPIWSVFLVMQCEAFEVKYTGASWTDHVYYDALVKSKWRKVGLDDKF